MNATLAVTIARSCGRHRDLGPTFDQHYRPVEHRVPAATDPSQQRRELIGA